MDSLAELYLSDHVAGRCFKALRPKVTVPAIEKDSEALIGLIALQSDLAAFATLFHRFAPRIKAYALRLSASHDLAEDIAQETMIVLWRKAVSFDPTRASAEAWIFSIARNLRVDAYRRAKFLTPNLEFPEEISDEPGADAVLGAAQYATHLRAALATLPAEQAAVIRLSFFDDRPHAEIERELGIPLGTVKSRLRLAMAKLRALLDDLK